jgi:hypothetical protein
MINKAPNEAATAADPSVVVQLSPNSVAAAAALADGTANPTTSGLAAFLMAWNGAFWDRARSASAAILAAFSAVGAQLAVGPGNWSQASVPGAAALATSTRAAGGAGVRHVCTSISTTFSTGATAQAAQLSLILRDGASGAGPQLWAKSMILPANAIWNVDISGLNIVGSANAAMTLEFTGAGVAGSFESVALTGYDAQ